MECSIDVVLDYDMISSAANKCPPSVKQLVSYTLLSVVCKVTARGECWPASGGEHRSHCDTPHLIDL